MINVLNVLGFLGNLTSFILWVPQAKTTYKYRNNIQALNGISSLTQWFALSNTIIWCINGFLLHSVWLSLGTVVIAPLCIWTLWLKRSKRTAFDINAGRLSIDGNELIESDDLGYFRVFLGTKTLCDHQGQVKLKQFDSTLDLFDYCKKYNIDIVQFNHKKRNEV